MKKILVSLAFILILASIPNLALAAWWNPLSWFSKWTSSDNSIHNIEETKTGILENKVKELEKKLENLSATTTATSTPVSTSTSAKTAAKPTQQKTNTSVDDKHIKQTIDSTQKKQQNFSSTAASYYRSKAELIKKVISILQMTSTDADRYVTSIPKLVASAENMASNSLDSKMQEIYTTIADTYSEHRAKILANKQRIDSYIQQLNNVILDLNSSANKLEYTFIPVSELKSHLDYTNKLMSDIDTTYKSYSSSYELLTNAFMKDKDYVTDYLADSIIDTQNRIIDLQGQQIRNTPSYQPSTQTNCFYTDYDSGGMANCYSY